MAKIWMYLDDGDLSPWETFVSNSVTQHSGLAVMPYSSNGTS
jgi:hypothetical protein